jgi:hypothetical protein
MRWPASMIAIGVAGDQPCRDATRLQQTQKPGCRVITKRILVPCLRQFTEIYQIVLGLG